MELEEILHYFNPWWEGETGFPGILRDAYLDRLGGELKGDRLTLVTGLRRVGKTTLMKQLIHTLQEEVDANRILFISLEHFGLRDERVYDIIDVFRKIHSLPRKERIYVFLDEITYKDDVARDLKIVHDNENVKLVASSSSATGLHDEKAYLTGRNRVIRIDPLDFREYLTFTGKKASGSERYLLESYFEEYMEYGGMPEYVLTRDPALILELVSDIIEKDVIARHDVKDRRTIDDLFLLLCERTGKQLTYNRLARILDVKPDTVKRYISLLEENHLFSVLPRHSKRLNERIRSPKKVYIGDVGIRNVHTGFRDKGAIYENLVFLRMRDAVLGYLYRDGTEIDFVTDETLVEAKYRHDLPERQEALMRKQRGRKSVVARGHDFFL
ncbi:MAG: ATP-binding protein [Candidatus Undinarchaeales archaeon]|jgi:hypothetical protein|nr:ATP-binding protein [Candidatus Undinarchaeales archaeon]MDP7492862.1 ATP-binding protein [Candidatus Undinarchaeales archaeon]